MNDTSFELLQMSFMYIKNSRGPNTEPYENPWRMKSMAYENHGL